MKLDQKLLDKLSKEVARLVLGGMPIEEAVKQVWAKYKIPQAIYESMKAEGIKAVSKALGFEIIDSSVSPTDAWKTLVGNDKTVKAQVARASARARIDVEQAVKAVTKEAKTVREVAVDLARKSPQRLSDVRSDLKKLVDNGASPKEVEKLRKSITNGVKGYDLRARYRSVLTSLEKGNEAKVQKQMEFAIQEKSRYNAQRIIRTETQRATAMADRERIAQDKDVQYVRFVLAGSHEPDECDAYANADLGWGKGVYPIDQAPVLPIHPNGRSRLVPVFVPKKTPKNGNGIDAEEALESEAKKQGVRLYNIQFSPITRKL